MQFLIPLAVVALVVSVVAFLTLPAWVWLAVAILAGFWLALRYGVIRGSNARAFLTPRVLAIVAATVFVVVVVLPTAPAIENLSRSEADRLQDVSVKGLATLKGNIFGPNTAGFGALSVSWHDSRFSTFSLAAFCLPFGLDKTNPITLEGSLKNKVTGVTYTAIHDFGSVCALDSAETREYELKYAKVPPGNYDLVLVAFEVHQGERHTLRSEAFGPYDVRHVPGA